MNKKQCACCKSESDVSQYRLTKRGGPLARTFTALCKTCHEDMTFSDLRGKIPYGYKWDSVTGGIVRNEYEQGTIDIISGLHRKGHSLRYIATVLNSTGIKGRARAWHPYFVSKLLRC